MKTLQRALAAILVATSVLFAFGCGKREDTSTKSLSYEDIVITDCVRLGAYEGLTVTLAENTDKATAVWAAVLAQSEIVSYPDQAVDYYVAQAEERYRYYAEKNGVSVEEAMAAVGLDDEALTREAKALVANDLIVLAVQKDAKIALTEDEKARLFDKYAQKYVEDFGYDLDYVKSNLSDLIYESMLYDKTTEYLILKNTFIV